jgi:hypothetical protein
VPETVAVNCRVWPTCTLALVGEIATETVELPPLTLIHPFAIAVADAALCAVTLTVRDFPPAGAVYRPLVEIVPISLLPPSLPLSSQYTRVLVVPLTDAVNCLVCPNWMLE